MTAPVGMKWLAPLFIAALFASATTASNAQTDPYLGPFAPKADCTVSGSVKNSAGFPIKGALLTLTTPSESPLQGKTDENGAFALRTTGGGHALTAEAAGHLQQRTPFAFEYPRQGDPCAYTLNFTLAQTPRPTPTPKPDAITAAYDNAINAYCKKKGQGAACTFYMEHAGACLTEAIMAEQIYTRVLMLKKQGLSSEQAIESTTEGAANQIPPRRPELAMPQLSLSDTATIAQGAASVIDWLNKQRQGAADNPKAPEVFSSTLVLPTCLKGIAQ
ncbi:MAG TPA: carboxypeptidase-like regulatory domain-containing protein [Candidatus Baltobacteraceae bacterium]|jgi:hypothetical protein